MFQVTDHRSAVFVYLNQSDYNLTMLQRLKNRPNLQKALANTGWLFADRILRMGIGLLVGVWVARYLGPEQFGLYNYAIAFVTLFSAIASLGLNSIVVRDLVTKPNHTATTLGTAFVLQIVGGFLAFGLAVFAIGFVRPNDELVKAMVAILTLAMLFKASEIVKYWFEAQVQSKYTVWVENTAFLIFAAIKVVLILQQAPLSAFVWAACAETALAAIVLLGIYTWRHASLLTWRFDRQRALALLNESSPLILTGLATIMYMRIDQIMLGQMLGDETVGIYSAASRISEIWYFIPIAINGTIKPTLLKTRKDDYKLYEDRIRLSFSLMIWISLPIAVVFLFISNPLISFLYGDNYIDASKVLAIHIWAGIFVFLNNAAWNWYLAEDMLKTANYRIITGLTINIGLNYLLIPTYGAIGAAWATLISRAFVAYFGQLLNKNTRKIFFLMTRSVVFYKI